MSLDKPAFLRTPSLLSNKGFSPGTETAATAVAISNMLRMSVGHVSILILGSTSRQAIYSQTRLGCPLSTFRTMKRIMHVNAGMIPSEKVK